MGYDGVVITDAMEMDAISKHFGLMDATKMAINADVDYLHVFLQELVMCGRSRPCFYV